MELNEYQRWAKGKAANDLKPETALAVWALGLSGEAGEVADLIKKHLGHGHPLSPEMVAAELGDLLWYVAVMAAELDYSLNQIAEINIAKLQGRYPAGFSAERSLNRTTEVGSSDQ